MRVIQIQYSTESAGRSAIRLHNAFEEKSHINSSIISMRQGPIGSEAVKWLGIKPELVSRVDKSIQALLTRKMNKNYGNFTIPVLGSNINSIEQILDADLIYFHWILGGFLNLKRIEQILKLGKPVVFVMHDMWMITGGCHYSFTCEKYKSECSRCPALKKQKRTDLSTFQFRKKAKLYSKYKNLHFISPSKWLFNCSKQSKLLRDKLILYIPNAIDSEVFKPVNKKLARKVLNIDTEDRIISFGSVSIESPYKGWPYLIKALSQLSHDNDFKDITVLVFGSDYNKKLANSIPFKTRFLGFLKDEFSMVLAYNAADVFVVPSLADNQPTTVMESLCCGTPVVGFDIGGLPDMIKHGHNGYLSKYKDPDDLVNGIKYCFNNDIRGKILSGFHRSKIIKQHEDLVSMLLNNDH
ncbi:MAG: glycosyltransferase [Bacteroidales bacterium]|nr:glycosyltransferase [Bacteroidales bacterium]